MKAFHKNNIACLRKSVNNYFTDYSKMFYEKGAAYEQPAPFFNWCFS
ncbi:hypothetical protein CHCC20488_3358 [Bacillus paralicheniformis]|nr:hypothetical protein CHCC5021_3444 [Bacillus paralicheniformis]TWJ77216.1 hypothetical protein CHCC20497_0764 [Bacillus paralicheniformis]TWL11519.1 hypothetical protein CHCC19468_2353 [Bacillus paralicheniformis]TWL37949.1 hypothetical protein CHCC15337_3290 [Bacillus paralicheniformis]TWL58810.1 hypothetical protein CHCC15332_1588 [Bacillus paralicheniformis]